MWVDGKSKEQELKERAEKKLAFAICGIINGDPEGCKGEYCVTCRFIMPRLKEAVDAVLALPELQAYFTELLKEAGYKSPEEINKWLEEQGALKLCKGCSESTEPLRLEVRSDRQI